MKLLLLAFLIFPMATLAAPAPFHPAVDERFRALEAAGVGGALASAKIIVGNGSDVATAVDMSGDATIANTGAVTIGAGKVLESMLKVQTADGLHAKRIARATYDCATDCAVGAHSLGVALPAKAIIVRSWIHVVSQMTDTGTCTVAIHCEDANNIKTATDISGTASGGFIEGASTGAASAFVGGISSACNITATTADGGSCAPAAGKIIVFVEYVIGE